MCVCLQTTPQKTTCLLHRCSQTTYLSVLMFLHTFMDKEGVGACRHIYVCVCACGVLPACSRDVWVSACMCVFHIPFSCPSSLASHFPFSSLIALEGKVKEKTKIKEHSMNPRSPTNTNTLSSLSRVYFCTCGGTRAKQRQPQATTTRASVLR